MTERLVAVSAGDSPQSKTRALAHTALALSREGTLIDLSALSAPGLLGREDDAEVAAAVNAASNARILVVATPVYRATYTGALKAFFDRFPPDALAHTVCVLCATAAIPQHFLSLDTGMRALVASLGGWSVPTVVYGTSDDFEDGEPSPGLAAVLHKALEEAELLAAAMTAEAR